MKKYRVWVKDIAIQDVEVEASSPNEARHIVEAQIADGGGPDIKEYGESIWEVESVDEITS